MTVSSLDQPDPIKNDKPAVWDLVLTDIAEAGMDPLEPLGAPLHDLYAGLLEAVVYVRALMQELPPELKAWEMVLADIGERDKVGQARYGVRLQPHNGRDALADLYAELLDAVVYARQAIYERDGQ